MASLSTVLETPEICYNCVSPVILQKTGKANGWVLPQRFVYISHDFCRCALIPGINKFHNLVTNGLSLFIKVEVDDMCEEMGIKRNRGQNRSENLSGKLAIRSFLATAYQVFQECVTVVILDSEMVQPIAYRELRMTLIRWERLKEMVDGPLYRSCQDAIQLHR